MSLKRMGVERERRKTKRQKLIDDDKPVTQQT